MPTEAKITPAMREWCWLLADGAACRLVRRTLPEAPAWKHYSIEGQRHAKPTWAMVDKLAAAGLIQWAARGQHEAVALLTARGREEANRDAVDAAPLAAWPFPISAHAWKRGAAC